MHNLKHIIAASLAVFLFSSAFAGQRRSPRPRKGVGKVMGVVLDPMDARIVGAKVTFWNAQVTLAVSSGEEGDFEVVLPAGEYRVEVESPGFRRFELSPFRVKPEVTELVNVHMVVGRGGPEPAPVFQPLETTRDKPSDRLSPRQP